MDSSHGHVLPLKTCIYCYEPLSGLEKDHFPACAAAAQCPYCGGYVPKTVETQHLTDCMHKSAASVQCLYCRKPLGRDLDLAHLQTCEQAWKCTVCGLFFPVLQRETHLQTCQQTIPMAVPADFRMVAEEHCGLCGDFVTDCTLADHTAHKCGKRTVNCRFCRQSITAETEKRHVDQCFYAWKCSKCGLFYHKADQNGHKSVCGQAKREITEEVLLLECEICHQSLDYRSNA